MVHVGFGICLKPIFRDISHKDVGILYQLTTKDKINTVYSGL